MENTFKNHKPICIIPARGGSKRIPHKNIKNFCGKPIIAYAIQNALESNLFSSQHSSHFSHLPHFSHQNPPHKNISLQASQKSTFAQKSPQNLSQNPFIIVSTDDKKIAKIAKQYGASVPFMRPSNLANDTAATLPVVAHTLDFLRDFGGDLGVEICEQTPVCVLYPTAVLIDFRHIVRSFEIFLHASDKAGCEYVFFANELAKNPLRGFVLESKMDLAGGLSDNFGADFMRGFRADFCDDFDEDFLGEFEGSLGQDLNADFSKKIGKPKMLFKQYEGVRSQDLPRVYVDAGALYWGRASTFCAQKPIFSSHSLAITLDSSHAQDIDTISDWNLAKAKFLALQKTTKAKNTQNTKND